MKDIIEILKEQGIEVPEDKQAEVRKALSGNYITQAEHERKIGKVETERDSLNEKLATAEDTLKGFDGVDVKDLQNQINDWKTKAEKAEQDYQKKIDERDFADLLKAEMDKLKFSSNSAKSAVTAQIKEAGLKVVNGKLVGFNDLIAQIKETDADAFASEGGTNPHFTEPQGKKPEGKKYSSKAEIMNIKNAAERQKAISENMELFAKS